MARVAINTGATANDGTGDTLRAAGGIINANFTELYTYLGAGSTTVLSAPIWNTTTSGINTLRNVGIGTTNPRFVLEVGSVGASGTTLWVNGDARVTGILTIGTSSITLDGTSNKINVGTGITIDGNSGIISATAINLGGTTLTGAAVTYITAGSGISVNQNTGNVTITATGGGGSGESYWASTTSGIHTLSKVGIGTTNPTSSLTVKGNTSLETLNVSGISTFNNTAKFTSGATGGIGVSLPNTQRIRWGDLGELSIKSDGTTSGVSYNYIDATDGYIYIRNDKTIIRNSETTTERLIAEFNGEPFNGENVKLYYGGNQKFETLGAGVTITGTTFTNQLNVSGVSTFSGNVSVSSSVTYTSGNAAIFTAPARPSLSIYQSTSANEAFLEYAGTDLNIRSYGSTYIWSDVDGSAATPLVADSSGSAQLYFGTNKKLETLGAGVTITGTTFTNQLNVSGVTTLGTVQVSSGIITASSGITTFYGDISNAVSGRWILGADGSSNYTFTGIGFTQTTNDPTLYLKRGEVYEFVNNSGGSHPFQIRASNGGSAYDNGVTNNGSASGTIRFEVPFNAPNTLYYQCTNHSGMGSTIFVIPRNEPAVGVRTTITGTTGSIGAGLTSNLNIDGFKSYGLLKVGISSAAWVVLYTDENSRTSDESRSYLTDPTPGSGVLAEVRTTTSGISTFLMSPGVIGWNNDVSIGSTVYARVTNNESSTSAGITVILTVVKLED